MPIRANYREGLNILEYFMSSRGARKGLADTALRTADSGYLTRRLVDVSQDVIIREDDCGATIGIEVYDIKEGNHVIEPLSRASGGPLSYRKLLSSRDGRAACRTDNHMMNDEDAKKIVDAGITRIKIRSVLNCRAKNGVCKKCYGSNLANGKPVTLGEAVGIIAAQSIGEPGTQLTMRTFHTGGIAELGGYYPGSAPRGGVVRGQKAQAGRLSSARSTAWSRIQEVKKSREIVVTDKDNADERKYAIPFGYRIIVQDGDLVHRPATRSPRARSTRTTSSLSKGSRPSRITSSREVQSVYRLQGVDINDKHIEVIVRQMMKKYRIDDAGDTNLMSGALVERSRYYIESEELERRRAEGETREDGTPLQDATYTPTLLGICKAALASDSFLSAASFQETAKVLTDAAIKGKVDPLMGLKENVIIGNLVPSGTGMKIFNREEGAGDHVTIGEIMAMQNPATPQEDVGEIAEVVPDSPSTPNATDLP